MNLTMSAKRFENNNGKSYRIVAVSKMGDYTFLIDDTPKVVIPYVIAWMCDEKYHSWGQGHYYCNFENALEDWNKKYLDK